MSQAINKDADNGTWVPRSNAYLNAPSGSMVHDSLEPINRPTKLMKLDDGRSTAFSVGSSNASNTNGSGLSQVIGAGSLPVNSVLKAEAQYAEKQISQVRVLVSICQFHNDISLSDELIFMHLLACALNWNCCHRLSYSSVWGLMDAMKRI
jgi:hypothetical protein